MNFGGFVVVVSVLVCGVSLITDVVGVIIVGGVVEVVVVICGVVVVVGVIIVVIVVVVNSSDATIFLYQFHCFARSISALSSEINGN